MTPNLWGGVRVVGNNANIQYPACSLVCLENLTCWQLEIYFFERQRSTSKPNVVRKSTSKHTMYNVGPNRLRQILNQSSTYVWTRIPTWAWDEYQRYIHSYKLNQDKKRWFTRVLSWQAVILSANSGTKSCFNSSSWISAIRKGWFTSVRVHANAAISPPPLVPVITCNISNKAAGDCHVWKKALV